MFAILCGYAHHVLLCCILLLVQILHRKVQYAIRILAGVRKSWNTKVIDHSALDSERNRFPTYELLINQGDECQEYIHELRLRLYFNSVGPFTDFLHTTPPMALVFEAQSGRVVRLRRIKSYCQIC